MRLFKAEISTGCLVGGYATLYVALMAISESMHAR